MHNRTFIIYVYVFGFALPLLLLGGAYAYVVCTLRQSSKQTAGTVKINVDGVQVHFRLLEHRDGARVPS